MAKKPSLLAGKHILIVDDEEDVLETIEDVLETARIDKARDYETASRKIREVRYDLAILDIMGVNGLQLLEEAVYRGIPTVMLTAHAITPETLIASIRKGAISYLPKETLVDLDKLLEDLLEAYQSGIPPWQLLFNRLGDYFDERFGPDWKNKESEFWSNFHRTYHIGQGIRKRLENDPHIVGKGI